MVQMRAIREWRGQEGRVKRGDIVEVSEDRARQLEGYEYSGGRVITPTTAEETQSRMVETNARAVRVENAKGGGATKGGPSAADEYGHEIPAPKPSYAATALANHYGVDLGSVRGTGAQGRVTKADVAAYLGRDPQDV